jgi:hypothetical protein
MLPEVRAVSKADGRGMHLPMRREPELLEQKFVGQLLADSARTQIR